MAALPSGTVTFVFTDVAGSTRLLKRLGPEEYAGTLAEYRRALRCACAAFGGVEVDTTGDGCFIAFSRAADAVAAARAAQLEWEQGPVSVRIGMHTGEPLLGEEGYVGMDVHRAARIAAAGHGGQVLVSKATQELVEGIEFVDLGHHRLKDLTEPERIFQLGTGKFPPLKSLNRTNLPLAAHPLVGRVAERAHLADLLREQRLVTITGTGGTGKTRLALQIAADLQEEFADGTFFVPLAGLTDPELVVPAVTRAIGLSNPDAYRQTRALVVLDNFEHLPGAVHHVAWGLTEAPFLTMLVTSRTPLRLSAEVEFPLDPLPPDAAVELFLQRAQSINRGIEPNETVRQICRRLDGLPLALELAAARLKLLAPAELLARLDARLPLLTGGPRDWPERQRTLDALIRWSYDLLEDETRALFARLSVFADGFGVGAAEDVADADLDTLEALVDASLVRPIGESRLLLLETIREFAANRLEDGARRELARKHAEYYQVLAERAAPELTGPDAATWLARLDADHANLRAALDELALGGDPRPGEAFALTRALWRFWLVRGHFQEAQTAIEHVLSLELDGAQRAELLYELGAIVHSRGDTAESERLLADALAGHRFLGDRVGEARSLMALGNVAGGRGEWQPARDYYEQATALNREIGDERGAAVGLTELANLLVRAGHPGEALAIADEALHLQRRLGYEQGVSLVLATQAYAHLATGEPDRARVLLLESTQIAHRLRYQHGLVYCLNGLARLAYETGDTERSADAFAAAQRLRDEIGIHTDPDEALVADARAAVEQQLGRPIDPAATIMLDLDELVAAAGLRDA